MSTSSPRNSHKTASGKPGAVQIGLFGLSAGGHLSLAVLHVLRDRGLGVPGAVVASSPMVDFAMKGDTWRTIEGQDPIISTQHYLEPIIRTIGTTDYTDPRVSPLYADFTHDWPPTMIVAGTREVMMSEAVQIYQALDQAGKAVKLDLYDGMFHGFHVLLPNCREAKTMHAKAVAWFRHHLI